jgi:hypothetical protein
MRILILASAAAVGLSSVSIAGPPAGAKAKTVSKCDGAQLADVKKFKSGESFAPGRYVFDVHFKIKFDVTLVGGGGGGGATLAGTGHPRWAEGGKRAELFRTTKPMVLGKGLYLIEVGAGGAGGQSVSPNLPAISGRDGGATVIRRCPAMNPIAVAAGGAGGRGDAIDANRAGDGESLIDPVTKESIGGGGSGGKWQEGGKPASGNGAGGGGEGAVTDPRAASAGRGSDGFARIVKQ